MVSSNNSANLIVVRFRIASVSFDLLISQSSLPVREEMTVISTKHQGFWVLPTQQACHKAPHLSTWMSKQSAHL
jgi:hypothetical protein